MVAKGAEGVLIGSGGEMAEVDPELARAERRAALGPLISELPEREQVMLYLRFYEGMTQSEIAKRLGISQMHVSRLQNRALRRLKEILSREEAVIVDDAA